MGPRTGRIFMSYCGRASVHSAAALLGLLLLIGQPLAQTAQADPIRAGFDGNVLPPNDDGSTGLVALGFSINFFGNAFTNGYVNNNGNMTFDQALGTFTPFPLLATDRIIIAPFFADVYTRSEGSSPVTYGQGVVGERPAFGVNWLNVGCFATVAGGFNSFQMILVDRSDVAPGDFDIEFNYRQVVWETGTASGGNSFCLEGSPARVGYSNGISTSFELEGSGIAGSFLDSNLANGLIHNSRNSVELGRYLFEVRNGNAPVGHHIAGSVYANDVSHPLVSALVQLCRTTEAGPRCNLTRTNAAGQYSLGGLPDGSYTVRAFPPADANLQPGDLGPVTLTGSDLDSQNIILRSPNPPPAGTTLTPARPGTDGLPSFYWRDSLTLSTRGCSGGTASFTVTLDNGNSTIATGSLTENAEAPGTYTGVIAPLAPRTGHATVTIHLACPDGSSQDVVFNIYIDPSGIVQTTQGTPVDGARVTLLRADTAAGPFEEVPEGSDIMSPTNRRNPDTTPPTGRYGWDVITGYYVVRAEAEGCTAPGNSEQSFVESPVLSIPPPVTDLVLTLNCGETQRAVCDLNGDGFVSRLDLQLIAGALRRRVEPGTGGDANRDGVISSQDVRSCTLQCTVPNCREPGT